MASLLKKEVKKIRYRRKEKRRMAEMGIRSGYDYELWMIVILLIAFGLIMLYSASFYEAKLDLPGENDTYYFMHQLMTSVLAVIAAVVVSKFDYHLWMRLSGWVYLVSIALMLMVPFVAQEINGAKRWISIGPISFQPSETAKLAVVVFIPFMILRLGKNAIRGRGLVMIVILIVVPFLCAFFLTDNLSTAIIILAIGSSMLFLAYPRKKRKPTPYSVAKPFLIFGGVIALFLGLRLWLKANSDWLYSINDFRLGRILVWLEPEKYMNKEAFQVMQGLYAIGSGGLTGKGMGNSAQKLATIPEAQNDMIFSIICEEFGLFGAVVLMVAFAYLLYRLFYIACLAPDFYGSMIAAGVFVHVAVQVLLNISVVLGVIPTTGVSLPFVSYGGTSVIFLMIEIGLALSVSDQIRVAKDDSIVRLDTQKKQKTGKSTVRG
uniref:Probable peptidoglycan glycosyltransferase FtsW n=1 Tax=Eubacterium cellulosolvens (strain ATCC 43171 / JCM 9499 / 6) TaxID=633697 RepID=I5AQC2_EUBC6